ncbi:hypothetical protein LRS74_02055 [Streptomyces sp. LX-29]|uniref:hypothetical protein n=1 Tax=Streptomyces sp. LX-29 TaxID=2900152 RepID=UPI00240D8B03|nr:hypothetical protein [Streptomyces sp. LX-29]WFB05948.1 hypothetical protein LRS74_02055 [Streptomyces sp. LX-29]
MSRPFRRGARPARPSRSARPIRSAAATPPTGLSGRLPGALWRRAAGRGPTAEGPSTAGFLRRRTFVLPALALVVLVLSTVVFHDVHGRTERLRDRLTPALVQLAQARTALELAQTEAERRLREEDGLVELGETYRLQLTQAAQSLNQVAQSGALNRAQEQELRVVSGLVVGYGEKIAWAERHRTSPLLRNAGLDYAAGMLRDPPRGTRPGMAGTAGAPEAGGATTDGDPSTILGRIGRLEAQLRDEVDDLAAWSPLTLAFAAATLCAAVVFAVTALGTLVFLCHRLRLLSLQLAVAAVPVLLLPLLLAVGGTQEHSAQRRVRTTVAGLQEVRTDRDAPRRIENTGAAAARQIDAAHPEGWSLTMGIGVACATAGALTCGVTLFLYARPYPTPARSRRKYPRT